MNQANGSWLVSAMPPWRDGVIFSCLLAIFTFPQHGVLASKALPTWVQQPPTGEIFFQATPPGKVTLDCVAKVSMGDPALTYSWWKNGRQLKWNATRMSMPHNAGTLTINPVLSEDEGFYQCQANNTWGVASSNVVNIRQTFLEPFPASEITNIRVREEDPLALYCPAPRSSPRAMLHWQKQSGNSPELHEIPDDNGRITLDSNGTLWFSHVIMSDASVDYTYVCTAKIPSIQQKLVVGNRVSIQVMKQARRTRRRPVIQFTSPDVQTAIRGSQVKLYCIYDGKPVPEVVWRKQNQPLIPEYDNRLSLKSNGQILMINNVTTADEGNYICIANNSAGEAPPHSTFLDVQVLPYFTVEPTSVTTREGEEVKIRCEAAGDPEPTVTWTRNGKSVAALSGQKAITIHAAPVADSANFGCNASNEIGHVYKDIAINVLAREDYHASSLDYATDVSTEYTDDFYSDSEHSTTERDVDTMDQDLTAVSVSSENVKVKWRSNRPEVNYKVTVTCQQTATSCNESLTNCPEPIRTFDINGLNELTFPATPYTEYEVQVTEIGPGGDTSMLKPFTVRAKEAVPGLPVMNLNTQFEPKESSISVVLTWEKPCLISADFSYYEVKWREKSRTTEVIRKSPDLSQLLTDLKPETEYIATVSPIYIVDSRHTHQSPGLSSMIGFTTPKIAPLRGKCKLGVEKNSKDTAMLTIQRCVFLDISDIQHWKLIVSRHPLTPNSGVGAPPKIPPWAKQFPETYVASPEVWTPFMLGEEKAFYSLGADRSGCNEMIWCNDVLQPDSDYYVVLRAVTSQGFMDSQVTHFRTVADANNTIIMIVILILGSITMCLIILHFCRRYARKRHHGVAEITQSAHFKTSDPEKQVYLAINTPQDVAENSPKVAHVPSEVKVQEDKEKLQSIDLGVIEEPKEVTGQGIDNQSFVNGDDDDVFEGQKVTQPQLEEKGCNGFKSYLNGDDDCQGGKVIEGQSKDDEALMNEEDGDDFQGEKFSPPIVDDQVVVTEGDEEKLKDQESLVDDLQEEISIQQSEKLGDILETAFE